MSPSQASLQSRAPTGHLNLPLAVPHFCLTLHSVRVTQLSPLSKQTRTRGPWVGGSAQLTYTKSLFCIQLYKCGGERGRPAPHHGAVRAGDRCIQRPSEGSRHRAPWNSREEVLWMFSTHPARAWRRHLAGDRSMVPTLRFSWGAFKHSWWQAVLQSN